MKTGPAYVLYREDTKEVGLLRFIGCFVDFDTAIKRQTMDARQGYFNHPLEIPNVRTPHGYSLFTILSSTRHKRGNNKYQAGKAFLVIDQSRPVHTPVYIAPMRSEVEKFENLERKRKIFLLRTDAMCVSRRFFTRADVGSEWD